MDGKHPKRRKDKYNPYTLTIEKGRYYLSFKDGQGVHHKMEIDSALYATFQQMLKAVSTENADDFDEAKLQELMLEKQSLQQRLDRMADAEQKRKNAQSRLDEIFTILDGLKNHPMEYDDQIVRQILECVVIENKEKIKVVFLGGLEVEQEL